MKRSISLFILVIAILTSSIAFAQAEPDTDGDGIGDSRDRCPTEAGPANNHGCPILTDSDSDGVPDRDDICPAIPGIPENRGCPTDSDGDGVGDFEDACPADIGTAANRGCPALSAEITPMPGGGIEPIVNPLVMPIDGPCVAATFLTGRINVRNAPRANATIIGVLDPNILYPVKGIIALPDEQESYFVITLENVLISSVVGTDNAGGFDPELLGGAFVAASVLKIGGECAPNVAALLLPAIQKIRAAALETARGGVYVAAGDLSGDGISETYLKVKLSDILVSSFSAGNAAADANQFSGESTLTATIAEDEDGDTLIFDLTAPSDPEALAAAYMKFETIKGESASTAPSAETVLRMVELLALAAGRADCAAPDVLARPTNYGIEFVFNSRDNALPECSATGDTHKDWIIIESFIADAGRTSDRIMVGQTALAFPGGGVGNDGAVCIDLQLTGAAALCLPAPLPAQQ